MSLVAILLLAWAAMAAIMAGAWLLQRALRNAGWVDAVWTLGLGATGIAVALAAGPSGPQVAVLSTHRDVRSAAASLTGPPWRDRLSPLVHDGPRGPVVELHGGRTRYASIHRFKGLEARAVVLTDIEHLGTGRERDLFYIGATRATQRLVVLAHESLRPQLSA